MCRENVQDNQESNNGYLKNCVTFKFLFLKIILDSY